jgi:multidrug resistance efflux pump
MVAPRTLSFAQQNSQAQVGCTGRVLPAGGIVAIGGIAGSTIRAVKVNAGTDVKRGDPLIELDDDFAKEDETLTALDLDATTKANDARLKVQALTVQLADQRLQRAQREAASYRAIGKEGTSEKEVARLDGNVEEARMALAIEDAKDQQLHTETASAARSAAKRLEAAKLRADKYVLRAPSDGTVLRIDRVVGEMVTGEPVLQFADLSSMDIACQVYQGDLLRLRSGMSATIKHTGLPDLGPGTVEQISRLVETRSQLGEVRIRLKKAEPANRLVGLEVEVTIAL